MHTYTHHYRFSSLREHRLIAENIEVPKENRPKKTSGLLSGLRMAIGAPAMAPINMALGYLRKDVEHDKPASVEDEEREVTAEMREEAVAEGEAPPEAAAERDAEEVAGAEEVTNQL